MRAYRSAWQTAVAVLAIVALAAASTTIAWPALLGAVGAFAVGGATCGYAWVEDPAQRTRAVGLIALWFAIAAALVLGLPNVVGPWSMVIIAAILASCPPAVELLLERRSGSRMVRTPDQARALRERDLELRWVRTGREVRGHGADAASVLALVQERALLLDEMERRDPEGFHALLVRAGWCEPQDHEAGPR